MDDQRNYMISTRDNTQFRWKSSKDIIGALEIPSEPALDFHGKYKRKPVGAWKEEFSEALQVWEEWGLRDEFIAACASVPMATCCFGLIRDEDTFIHELIPIINNGWVKAVNKKLKAEQKSFKIDLFIWTWSNISGKTSTSILLIRFFNRSGKMGSKEASSRDLGTNEASSYDMELESKEMGTTSNRPEEAPIPEK